MDVKTHFADAVFYWEPRRVIYNAVLALLVIFYWGADILAAGPSQWVGAGLVLLTFAGIANALYCLAYPVDLAFQMSPLHATWQRFRWLLFATGLLLASGLAIGVMLAPGMA